MFAAVHNHKLLATCLLCTVLAGCAGLGQRAPSSPGWQVHSSQLALLEQWTASGKLALRTAEASDSASMTWQQRGGDTHLQLSGPLGVGATTIDSDGRELSIRQGDGEQVLDVSTPEAIALNTGWDLPLPALIHWLKGLPYPGARIQHFELDEETALLRSLRQDGWDVSFERYGEFQGFILPTRLQIQRGTTRARVIISNWQTFPG